MEAVTDVSPFMQHFQQWLQQGRASGAVADSYSHLAVHSCQSLSFVEFCLSGNGRPFALTIFCVWKFFLGFPSPFYCASFLLLCAFSLLCIFWLLCFSAFLGFYTPFFPPWLSFFCFSAFLFSCSFFFCLFCFSVFCSMPLYASPEPSPSLLRNP